MGTKAWGFDVLLATAGRASGFGGAARVVFFDEPHCFLPSAISARLRPVAIEASISILASPSPGTANSSFSLISNQLLRFDGLPRSVFMRIRAHLPCSRSPWTIILTLPRAKASARSSSCGSQVPRSHSCTVPAP